MRRSAAFFVGAMPASTSARPEPTRGCGAYWTRSRGVDTVDAMLGGCPDAPGDEVVVEHHRDALPADVHRTTQGVGPVVAPSVGGVGAAMRPAVLAPDVLAHRLRDVLPLVLAAMCLAARAGDAGAEGSRRQ